MRWKDLRESKKESIINEKEAAVKKNEEVKPEKKMVVRFREIWYDK